MSFDFDLNILNYTISELENFFGLDFDYTFNDILKNQENMVKIIRTSNYDAKKKNNVVGFMDSAKNILVERFKKRSEDKDNEFDEEYDKLLVPTDEKDVINQTGTTYAGHTFVMNKETTTFNKALGNAQYLNPVESYPTNISRSMLNNLKRKTIKQTVILNSLYREDYLTTPPSDFNIVLPSYFKNVLSLRLSSIQLPNVIYCISSKNNNNTVYIWEENTELYGVAAIPSGNYSAIDFVALLQSKINTTVGVGCDRFRVTHDETTGKITVSNTVNNFTMNFLKSYDNTITYLANKEYKQINCVPISETYKRLGWVMGYRQSEYKGDNAYITEGIYNGAYTDYVYFVLNDFNNSQSQNIIGMFSKSLIGDNILAMVPLTSSNFSVCFDNGSDFIEKKREYFGPVNIQRLKIQLLNQYGELIDLNNMDFSFSLELEIGYDW